MVTIERRVRGLVRYRKVWFPSGEQAREISRSLRANDVVRFFAVAPAADGLVKVVEQYRMPTVWIRLAAGPAAVYNGMKRRSCRKEIRRAEKMLGRVVIESGSEKSDRDFLTVYNEFTEAKGLPKLRASWVQENAAHCETFVLYLDGSPLCSHLVLRDPETKIVRPLYSGSRRLESPEQASACGALNRYLHWHEMQRYYEEGFANYDFGGLGEESIARFKLSFGGSILTQHFYLLSGMRWVAKLGKFVYERIRGGRTFKPEEQSPYERAEDEDLSVEARP